MFLSSALGESPGPAFRNVCLCVTYFQASDWLKVVDVARRRQTAYNVARLLLMVPLEPWQNSTLFFGAVAFCTSKIDNFRRWKDENYPKYGISQTCRDHPNGRFEIDLLGNIVNLFIGIVVDVQSSPLLKSLTTLSTYSSPLLLTYYHHWYQPPLIVDIDLSSLPIVDIDLPSSTTTTSSHSWR